MSTLRIASCKWDGDDLSIHDPTLRLPEYARGYKELHKSKLELCRLCTLAVRSNRPSKTLGDLTVYDDSTLGLQAAYDTYWQTLQMKNGRDQDPLIHNVKALMGFGGLV